MLRIRWVLPVGGVLLAIVLLTLAFRAPDRSHSQLMPNVAQMRVTMIEQDDHRNGGSFSFLAQSSALMN
jgi:hypothetical protein